MNITHKNGIWAAEATFEERAPLKLAGFWWHPGLARCNRSRCSACEVGHDAGWWTFKPEIAARLLDQCDDGARAALADHLESLEASRATDSSVDIPAPAGLSYYPFQRAGIAYGTQRESVLIADEMGLGKTIQALGIINADETIKSALIVVPASLRINWAREAATWLTREFNVYVAETTKAPPADADIVIVNYAKINRKAVREALMARSWDVLIADEAHYAKNKKAQRTKALLGWWNKAKRERVEGLVDRSRRRVFLTGTPILNKPVELHPLLAALDPRQFGNFMRFAKRYCNAHQISIGRGRTAWDFTGSSNLDELQERLRSTVMVRRLKSEVLPELPPKRRQVITLPPNGASNAIAAERRAFVAHESAIADARAEADLAQADGDESAYNASVARLRSLEQLAFTEMSRVRHEVAVAKIEKVIEHVESLRESGIAKIVLFAHHHDVIDAFMSQWGSAAVELTGRTPMAERQAAVDRFQTDDTCEIFVASIKAAGVGLTLTASSTVVFAELDWVPANIQQAEDRCHRIGQTGSVLVQHLVFNGSIDADMAHRIISKQQVISAALDDSHDRSIDVEASSATRRRPRYPKATEAQRGAAGVAMQVLAGMCDGARTEDGCGFNRVDTRMGKSLAERASVRPLTDGETWLAARIAPKYHRQLPEGLIDTLKGVR